MEASTSSQEVQLDWYRFGFPPKTARMPWADKTVAEVDRALAMLQAEGSERVLDLACGIGRHSMELTRRGFSVVGIDISPELIEMAESDARSQSLEVEFLQADLRDLDYEEEFDLVLTLNDGAVGYFETEEENRRTFEIISRALKKGGRNVMQLPNVLHAEKNMPYKTWIPGEATLELIDHRWNADLRYLEGATVPIRIGEVFEEYAPIPFRQRLYSVEELTEVFDSVGMAIGNVYRGNGKVRHPTDKQFEIFVTASKV